MAVVGGTLYQGLLVHADGRFVADLEMGAGVVRTLRMARSDAAGGAGWRDLTGKLVFPGPVVLSRSNAPRAWRGGLPATTVAVPVANLTLPFRNTSYSRPAGWQPHAGWQARASGLGRTTPRYRVAGGQSRSEAGREARPEPWPASGAARPRQ